MAHPGLRAGSAPEEAVNTPMTSKLGNSVGLLRSWGLLIKHPRSRQRAGKHVKQKRRKRSAERRKNRGRLRTEAREARRLHRPPSFSEDDAEKLSPIGTRYDRRPPVEHLRAREKQGLTATPEG